MIGLKEALFLLLVLLASCGERHFFEVDHQLGADGWAYTDTLDCSVLIEDTTGRYDLIIDLRHDTEYAHQNLYIKIYTTFPDGKALEQTVPIDFADSRGNWYGDCGTNQCQLRVVLQEQAIFDQLGTHRFQVVQYMRIDPVQHIQSAAFILDLKKQI